ncbi:HEAT repeat domain-containing protein [Desertifilum sp. FACHB-1129]|uniref:PBS lyase n=1 Tax=Desertifilum tharense IPPAS B-1220 TaxID=1781255 RepID=A0A1E5QSF9_9CYAN|nr:MULTISPECIES: HEAT repeat domain-containing protein [Desertifilum]MDA0210714.1 HEAT repeat domain-containing protein [Cyanobacteria bacterium FC1]MBD2312200.1 HEAT repeat domain-containing protein [Desertifilum sp. FACHB-1129]MBD2323733.1 HEAT repeat domain-containing protein [Desertifilum sp. FACHB-866]MBD2332430.1 HEAT repeat domain-containing protein [Desertifilum sp. FACHB-868]OEJ77273.1 PBS lyase [Desertifilum tharense IPPAS B-1220]
MELNHQGRSLSKWVRGLLQWVNLRPEESERTLLMLAFYTVTCIGLTWAEACTVALFLEEYGANALPWIYVASAVIGSCLGFLYSWLQRILPLRRVIVGIALLLAVPLFLLRFGLEIPLLAMAIVFLLRLWVEAIYVLNELNTTIAANQLFTIREIKRTYPLISSGVLVADIISGFSLPLLLAVVGLRNAIVFASIMMALGAGILFYLCQNYEQSFPDAPQRLSEETHPDYTNRRFAGPLKQYIFPLIAFFVIAQALLQVIEFQFFGQLETRLSSEQIAGFLGLFNGILGIFEVSTQWFVSSRVIERIGIFTAASLLPGLVGILGLFSLTQIVEPFKGLIALKFLDELLRYTFVLGVGPGLFQPIPDNIRNRVQSIRGIAEPISIGGAGLALLTTIWVCRWANLEDLLDQIFLIEGVLLALAWLLAIYYLRQGYVDLLVTSAERGRLSISDVDLRKFKQAVAETLEKPGREDDKRACIELLHQIDPKNVNDVLVPLLPTLSPALQRQSLEVLLDHPKPEDLPQIRLLTEQSLAPEVLAIALRYIWLTEPEPDIRQLRPYLQPQVDPVVRGAAAALMLRRGSTHQVAEATNTLRRMLKSEQERERVMGCRALGDALRMQALRVYIQDLLQDESLRVRCALLEAIAATKLEEYYPSLLRGLTYPSTREAAMRALVRLEDDAIPLLLKLAEDIHKPDLVRMYAWSAIGQIGTPEALDRLCNRIYGSWGRTRLNILQVLLKVPDEKGIERVQDRLGRSGIECLVDQELMFIGQIYSALIDLRAEKVPGREGDLLRRSLLNLQEDAVERSFALMKFLYPINSIQAAAFNLQSSSLANVARGLEILDNTLDLPSKRTLLLILDRCGDDEKLAALSNFVTYEPLMPSDRLRYLLELRHFLSDWPLACCFHLARVARWGLTAEQTLACLRHPTGFVREAVLAYLKIASPRSLVDLLPLLKNDPDRLVVAQVQEMMEEFGIAASTPVKPNVSIDGASDFTGLAGFGSF